MSRIFEAIKNAQIVRLGEGRPKPSAEEKSETHDRRGSRRLSLTVSVYVYGHDAGEEPFHEEAHTLRVNANGGLLLLSVPVREGQKLLLTNRLTQKEQECRVVFLGTRRSRTVEAGVAFPEPNPDFWHIPSPPHGKPAA